MKKVKFVSLSESVFERIEDMILSGEFPVGSLYTECKLSEMLGVSRTPIREAIRRLEQENLIRITTKGAEITGVSIRDLEDIYEIRSRIEGLAARKCAEVITDDGIKRLEEIIDLQEFYISKEMPDNIKDTDSAFHETIYEICGSGVYFSVLSNLHRKIRKYRKLSIQNPGRAEKAMTEHRDILGALKAHDGSLAEKLTSLHIGNARDSIKQIKNFN